MNQKNYTIFNNRSPVVPPKKTICFVAGKSGGHIIPCLTIAAQRKKKDATLDILFFSSDTALDATILSNNELVSRHIMLPLQSIAAKSVAQYFKLFCHIAISLVKSFFYLCKYKPSEIMTTGGVVALPVCVAAFVLRIPIVLYSLDAVPGKAIKALVPLATQVNVSFKSSSSFFPSSKCTFEHYPIRYEQTDRATQEQALHTINFDKHKKTVLILGGSQGSLFLNDCIKKGLTTPFFEQHGIQLIHQTGSLDATDWNLLYKQHNVTAHVFSYHPYLASLYSAADLIICRAGAGTLFEVEFFKKQCLVIPLSTHTTTHQKDNAHVIAQEYPHLFHYIHQEEIEKDSSVLFSKINELLYK